MLSSHIVKLQKHFLQNYLTFTSWKRAVPVSILARGVFCTYSVSTPQSCVITQNVPFIAMESGNSSERCSVWFLTITAKVHSTISYCWSFTGNGYTNQWEVLIQLLFCTNSRSQVGGEPIHSPTCSSTFVTQVIVLFPIRLNPGLQLFQFPFSLEEFSVLIP